MTGNDLEYVRNLLSKGLIEGPVLELGGGYGGIERNQPRWSLRTQKIHPVQLAIFRLLLLMPAFS